MRRHKWVIVFIYDERVKKLRIIRSLERFAGIVCEFSSDCRNMRAGILDQVASATGIAP